MKPKRSKQPREPRWIIPSVIEALHHDQIVEHGGLPGLRDPGALEAALNRARHKWSYDPGASLASLASAYAFGIAKSHPFHDGNKRMSFLAMVVFLERTGWSLGATDPEVVETILGLASGSLTEPQLATWIEARLRRKRPAPRRE